MKNTVFPHKFWRPFLDCMPQLFFRPQYVWFPVHLKGHLIPLCYKTLVVNWQNWLFTLFHQSRSVLSPNPIEHCSNHKAAILKATSLKIVRLLPIATKDMHMKFETEIPKQNWVTLPKPYCLQSPETKNLIWPPGSHLENEVTENH